MPILAEIVPNELILIQEPIDLEDGLGFIDFFMGLWVFEGFRVQNAGA